MREEPDRWEKLRVGDVLMDEARGRVFQVVELEREHGYFTRVTITVLNVMSLTKTSWTVAADRLMSHSDLTWIGEGA